MKNLRRDDFFMDSLEKLKFQSELQRASLDYIEALLKISDKYHVNRDKTVVSEIRALLVSVSGASFEEYEVSEDGDVPCDTEN